jgi:hypothetical protein
MKAIFVKSTFERANSSLERYLVEFERSDSKKISPIDLNIGIIQKIFDKTSGEWGDGKCAYSYSIYGPKNWMDIIKWLRKEGFTPMETEEILRSKLMRWAGDKANKSENVTLKDFKEFNNELYKGKTQIDEFLDKEIRPNKEEFLKQTGFNENVNEDAMGGVNSPMSTLNNTPGMGNAQPAQMAAMTGSQQQSPLAKGSGDKWGGSKPYTQAKSITTKKKKKKKKLIRESLLEENINPYEKRKDIY